MKSNLQHQGKLYIPVYWTWIFAVEAFPKFLMVFILQTKCRFDVDLTDDTSVMTASVFGELAEQVLGFTAVEAMDLYNKFILNYSKI